MFIAEGKIRILIILILSFLLIYNCKREFTNLCDPGYDGWGPCDIIKSNPSRLSFKLDWDWKENELVTGFKIDRKVNNEDWEIAYKVLDKNTRSYEDKNLFINKEYYYRIYAYAGECNSEKNEFSYFPKPSIPDVQIFEIKDIETSTAKSICKVIDNGGMEIIERGLCLSLTPNPNLLNRKFPANEGPGTGWYSCLMHGLIPGTLYHVKAYAINSLGEGFSDEDITFTTEKLRIPQVRITKISNETTKSAEATGKVDHDGGAEIIARGFCWSTDPNPTKNDFSVSVNVGQGMGWYNGKLSKLQHGTLYYVKAYATNSQGDAYSNNEISFTTIEIIEPVLLTSSISETTHTSAKVSGKVEDNGGSDITSRGFCWSTDPEPDLDDESVPAIEGPGLGWFNGSLTGLKRGTKYFVRAYASNSVKTGYGNQIDFYTLGNRAPNKPEVIFPQNNTTNHPLEIKLEWECVDFEEDPLKYDVWYGEDPDNLTKTGNQITENNCTLRNLRTNTKYYWKIDAFDYNHNQSTEGDIWCFWTTEENEKGTLIDIRDGKVYSTIKIGNQWWMAENLNYETNNSFCYNNRTTYCITYGRLYNWAEAMKIDQRFNDEKWDGSDIKHQGICPDGWHIPSDDEWKIMEMYLGMNQGTVNAENWRGTYEGGSLKETGYKHWNYPNTGATNGSGFSALPGGDCWPNMEFHRMGFDAYFWTSSEYNNLFSWYRRLNNNYSSIYRYYGFSKKYGRSIRCVKD